MLERRVLTYIPKDDIPSSAWEYGTTGRPNVIYIPLNGANANYTELLGSNPCLTFKFDDGNAKILNIGPFLFTDDSNYNRLQGSEFIVRMHYYTDIDLDSNGNYIYCYIQPEIIMGSHNPIGLGFGYIIEDYTPGMIKEYNDTVYYIKIKFDSTFYIYDESFNMDYYNMYSNNCPVFLDYE